MEHLDITIAKLSSASGNIRQTNQRLNQCLQEINTVMNQLSLYWNSPASLALKTRFQNMLPEYDPQVFPRGSSACILSQFPIPWRAFRSC